MQTELIKSSHLNIRISELSKNILQQAATLEGDSLSHFVISHALEHAHKLISESQNITLSSDEQMRFFDLLENPKPLNEKLNKAIDRYSQIKANESEI